MARPTALAVLLVLVGCSDHRYGFFGDDEASGGPATSSGGTDTAPDPTVATLTTPDPTAPVPTTDPTTPTSDPTAPVPTTDPTVATIPDPSDTITVTSDPTGTPGVCGEQVLPPVLPAQGFGDNVAGGDLFALSCNSFSSDSVFVWTAPFDGVFRFDTIGSDFDTVLAVFDDFCGGVELGCDDDSVQLWSEVVAKLGGGQTVTLVVEGLGGLEGNVVVTVSASEEPPPPTCDAIEAGSDLLEVPFSTFDAGSAFQGTCGGENAPERVARWTPPFPGLFRFATQGSDYDPLLHVRRGGCDGVEIGCSDDFDGLEAGLDLFLDPVDGPVFIFVDGAGGSAGSGVFSISAL
jgi:hypothetical protein